jgi:hypothetical protein
MKGGLSLIVNVAQNLLLQSVSISFDWLPLAPFHVNSSAVVPSILPVPKMTQTASDLPSFIDINKEDARIIKQSSRIISTLRLQ